MPRYRKSKGGTNEYSNTRNLMPPKRKSKQAISVILAGVMALSALPAVWYIVTWLLSFVTVSYTELSVSDTNAIRSVFFSGDPWVVLCEPSDPREKVPRHAIDVLHRVASLSAQLPLHQRFSVGKLACHDRLPSNRTVYGRFRFSPSSQMVVVANGDSPRSVPSKVFRYQLQHERASRESRLVDVETMANAVVGYAVASTKLRKAFRVTTELQLKAQCLRKKFCALLLVKNGPASNVTKATMRTIMAQHRTVHYTHMDWDKYALSFESKLPPLADGVSDESVRLLFFRTPTAAERYNISSTTKPPSKAKPKVVVMAKAYRHEFNAAGVGRFLSEMMDVRSKKGASIAGMKRFPRLMTRQQLEKVRAAEAKRLEEEGSLDMQRRRAERAVKRKKREAMARAESESPKLSEKELRAREKERRDEMDREQAAATAQAADNDDEWGDDDDDDDGSSSNSDDDDEEVVDLDDEDASNM